MADTNYEQRCKDVNDSYRTGNRDAIFEAIHALATYRAGKGWRSTGENASDHICEIEEYAQETVLQILERFDKYAPRLGVPFSAWVNVCMGNRAIDSARKAASIADYWVNVEQKCDENGNVETQEEALSRMSCESSHATDAMTEEQEFNRIRVAWQIANDSFLSYVARRTMEGASGKTIAAEMNIEYGAFTQRLHRFREAHPGITRTRARRKASPKKEKKIA